MAKYFNGLNFVGLAIVKSRNFNSEWK